jgi:hypothetical protein
VKTAIVLSLLIFTVGMVGCFGHDNRILDDIEHPQRLDGLEASG